MRVTNKYETNIGESQLAGGCRPVGYLQSVVELSSGLPKTNPASGREEDLELDLKISSLAN